MWCPIHTVALECCYRSLFSSSSSSSSYSRFLCLGPGSLSLPRTCTITLSLEDTDCTSFTFYSSCSSFDEFASDFQLAFSCLKFDPNCLKIVLPALDLLWICSLHFKLDHITTIFCQHHSKYLWTDRLHPSALDQCFSHYVSQPISEFSSQFSGLW